MKAIALWFWQKLKHVYLKMLMKHLLSLLIKEMKDEVMFVVASVDEDVITDEEKRKHVFQLLKHRFISKGKEMPNRLLNLAIELAVNILRLEQKALLERLNNIDMKSANID